MSEDERFMQRALELARQAQGYTSPNPMVGAVIVRDGEIVAEGYHHAAGQPHGEIEALRALEGSAEGLTMYVNLEPCSHYGRTPPCADAVIEAGLARVVIGILDPNPQVNGRGVRRMQDAGIDVSIGVMEQESLELNEAFFTYIQKKRPFVSLKIATSLDSRIATRTGDSQWLSSEPARVWAHEMRAASDAILVGAGTVMADDPSLTVRHVEGPDPLRVVLDSHLRSPLNAKMFQEPLASGTVVYCTQPDEQKAQQLRAQGVAVELLPAGDDGRVQLTAVLDALAGRDCQSLLVEGGGEIHGAFLNAGLVDKVQVVLTPWLLGEDGRPAFRHQGQDRLHDSLQLASWSMTPIGPDFLLEARPKWPVQKED